MVSTLIQAKTLKAAIKKFRRMHPGRVIQKSHLKTERIKRFKGVRTGVFFNTYEILHRRRRR